MRVFITFVALLSFASKSDVDIDVSWESLRLHCKPEPRSWMTVITKITHCLRFPQSVSSLRHKCLRICKTKQPWPDYYMFICHESSNARQQQHGGSKSSHSKIVLNWPILISLCSTYVRREGFFVKWKSWSKIWLR